MPLPEIDIDQIDHVFDIKRDSKEHRSVRPNFKPSCAAAGYRWFPVIKVHEGHTFIAGSTIFLV
jgi:hypothetical protein